MLKDGKIVRAVSEERFTRRKNEDAVPANSWKWVLESEGITGEELDAVAVVSTENHSDYEKARGVALGMPSAARSIWATIDYAHPILRVIALPLVHFIRKRRSAAGRKAVKKILLKRLGVPESKIHFIDHHTCHAYAGYFGMTDGIEEALVLTLDGEGDGLCATVNIAREGRIRRIAATPLEASIGLVYAATTIYMGMKPLEHEYKLMGLAPYAKEYYKKTYERVFKPMIWLDENELSFKSAFNTQRSLFYLDEMLKHERFDNIAASVQRLTEDLLVRWVRAAVKKTGVRRVILSGGVFMNVKANMLISELPEVEELYPLPSCGDESTPFGAVFYAYKELAGQDAPTTPLKDLYLGMEFGEKEIKEALARLGKNYDVRRCKNIAKEIAGLLAEGEIVARCSGRMEWGARSLGNRAILANPSTWETVRIINEQIKSRDFWMPFAPTLSAERADDYLINPKKIPAPYMIMAFRSKPLARKELVAAMHPADFTLRPQILENWSNPDYYRILEYFEKETGIGGVLNTSFNLHGEPMVCSPTDALYTMERSGLRHLVMGNIMVSKR